MERSPALDPSPTALSMASHLRSAIVDVAGDSASGELGLPLRGREPTGSSSVSVTSSDYRSIRSSPSPPQFDAGNNGNSTVQHVFRTNPSELSSTLADNASDLSQSIPDIPRSTEFPVFPSKHNGMFVTDGDGILWNTGSLAPGSGRNSVVRAPYPRMSVPSISSLPALDNVFAPDGMNSSMPVFNPIFKSVSPSSSSGSGGPRISNFDPPVNQFEAQLKASPIIADLLDRLARSEFTNREIQRELNEAHQKVNILLERSLGPAIVEPEFKNPFASGPHSRSITPSGGLLAPHQTPNVRSDDISQLSQRLNALTTSVGQLLAFQTRQQINSSNSNLAPQGHLQLPRQSVDIAPNQPAPTPALAHQSFLGHGLPNRQDLRPSPRMPNPPMRTWSAGTLELPMRGSDSIFTRPDNLSRDKRRSVVGMMRRESMGVLDSPGEHGMGNNTRDNGPIVTKWEHLPLLPELLRSLGKFGVGPPNKIQQRALPFLLRGADIIAQAPPTQERIAAYVIPAIHVALTHVNTRGPNRGPLVLMISTTVDQATQAQRMIRDIGGSIGIRSALGVGSTLANSDVLQEVRLLQQNNPHILCGTPQKLHALFSSPGGLVGSEVRFLVLDEVDQLIARNLHDFVHNIIKFLPPPRSRPNVSPSTPSPLSQAQLQLGLFDAGSGSALGIPFQNNGRRASSFNLSPGTPGNDSLSSLPLSERQTALFSNTVPQDVLNLATTLQLREPVRVLVRRDGNVTNPDSNQSSRGLRQFYLYLAFTASGRSDASPSAKGGPGHGIIGSGRNGSSAETTQAREWKLDALADLFSDIDVRQAIVHVGSMATLDIVVYKLASIGLEAVPLHSDMNGGTKLAAMNKFRGSISNIVRQQPTMKVLVVYDVQVKPPEIAQVSLVINYDLPKAVEEYALRVAPAISSNNSRAGVVVNFVTATGGDVEMLRSIECFYKIKCPEVPMSLRDLV